MIILVFREAHGNAEESRKKNKQVEEEAIQPEGYMSILYSKQSSCEQDLHVQNSEDQVVNPVKGTEVSLEVTSLRDKLEEAEKKASQVQREVRYINKTM